MKEKLLSRNHSCEQTMKTVAIDFETFNSSGDSACSVGVAVIEDNEITKTHYRLIRPPTDDLNPYCYRVHGICWDDVKKEPDFKDVWQDVWDDIQDASYFLAHNAGFDQRVLSSCCDYHGIDAPESEFLCSIELAQSFWSLDTYKLKRVCQFLKIPLKHHNALSDAEASAQILLRAVEHGYQLGGDIEGEDTKWLSTEVMSMVDAIMADGKVDREEIHSAADWLKASVDAASVWPGTELKAVLDKILEDGAISDEELTDFQELCCILLGKQERKKRKRASRKQPGQLAVCFTGFGAEVKKEELQAAAEAAGFHVTKSVTKTLDYLVCGAEPGPSKLEKATAQGVKIVSAEEWKPIVSAAADS
jgi:DNA polymerase-3 subunit epsilon